MLLSQLSLELKCPFRSRQNEDRDDAEVTLGGNAFHARAAASVLDYKDFLYFL